MGIDNHRRSRKGVERKMMNIRKTIEWAVTIPLAILMVLLLAPYFLIKRLIKGDIYDHSLDYVDDYKGRKIRL